MTHQDQTTARLPLVSGYRYPVPRDRRTWTRAAFVPPVTRHLHIVNSFLPPEQGSEETTLSASHYGWSYLWRLNAADYIHHFGLYVNIVERCLSRGCRRLTQFWHSSQRSWFGRFFLPFSRRSLFSACHRPSRHLRYLLTRSFSVHRISDTSFLSA